jgi:hypothetical protein
MIAHTGIVMIWTLSHCIPIYLHVAITVIYLTSGIYSVATIKVLVVSCPS